MEREHINKIVSDMFPKEMSVEMGMLLGDCFVDIIKIAIKYNHDPKYIIESSLEIMQGLADDYNKSELKEKLDHMRQMGFGKKLKEICSEVLN